MTSRYPQECVTTWFSACTRPIEKKSRVPHATTLPEPADCASRLFNASPGSPRASVAGKLIEGNVTTNWKQALAQLSLAYPERINTHL